jgi:ornithine cyclodeaminase
MLVLTRTEVERLLPMRVCIDLMTQALSARARGDAIQPLRTIIRLPDGSGILASMPAWVGTPAALGVKVISVFPGNHAQGRDSHQGGVLYLDPHTGELDAILEAGAITAIRTAAVSGVATRHLARSDAGDVAILGAGVQAFTHLQAMREVRKLRRVRIWNRSQERAARLVARVEQSLGIQAEIMPSAEAAVRDADIVCAVTAAREPVLRGDWLSAGAHLNAVGSSVAEARELDTAAVARARLFVDARESALHEAGDLLIPIREGRLTADHIVAELGEVLIGRPGRRDQQEITLFKSLGLGIEDVAAAGYLVTEARRAGAGQEVRLTD